jgi:hypothetical protein
MFVFLYVNKDFLLERYDFESGAVKWDRNVTERDRGLFVCDFVNFIPTAMRSQAAF